MASFDPITIIVSVTHEGFGQSGSDLQKARRFDRGIEDRLGVMEHVGPRPS
jgi:hypothetical protein